MARAEFDADNHVYVTPGGRRLPGVTSVLRSAGLISKDRMDEAAMARGTRVHSAIEFDCQADLNESTMDQSEIPYVWAARRARDELGLDINPDDVEVPVCNEALGFGTRVDALCTWKGGLAVINWKTGGEWSHYPIQMALEALCCGHLQDGPAIPKDIRRLAIHLSDSGNYRLVEHVNAEDFAVARACATIASWKRRDRR